VGQAAVARDEATRQQLLAAAQEETDHLAWCNDRLLELDSRPSLFNPLWYAGSYAIGVAAGLRGDGWNLGFVVETNARWKHTWPNTCRPCPRKTCAAGRSWRR
jgi:ubiquinone biosynthesis monooxygenase Coq7